MTFRKAILADASEIRAISLECSVSRHDKLPGFVDFLTPTTAEYKSRIAQSRCFLVSIDGEAITGFAAGYLKDVLAKTHEDDALTAAIRSEARENFVYIEQIAVRPEYRRAKTAQRLTMILLSNAKNAGCNEAWAAISHTPVRNEPSIRLVAKYNFQLVKESVAIPGLVFGLYKTQL